MGEPARPAPVNRRHGKRGQVSPLRAYWRSPLEERGASNGASRQVWCSHSVRHIARAERRAGPVPHADDPTRRQGGHLGRLGRIPARQGQERPA